MDTSDDDLILYHYGDGLAHADAKRIERAIADDPAVAARYRALAGDLERLGAAQAALAPPEALGRWKRALDAAAQPAPAPSPFPGFRFAAAALVLAAGIGIAFFALREDMSPVRTPEGPVAGVRFERALEWHLVELESQLSQASQLPAAERGDAIRRLAQQNRVQTAVAERAGAGREARVLRAFTVALDGMAADPHGNGDFKAAVAQLDFEMRVMQARLASASPSPGARSLAL